MKRLLLITFTLIATNLTQAQTSTYASASGEMIFSFAKITRNDQSISSNLRWSPVFNFQSLINHDKSEHFGIFYGIALRNVGFIYEIPGTDTLKKYRTYNFGIPLGIKLGNLKKGLFVYGGYEFEMPISYKEKTFINEVKKEKDAIWFTNRVNWYTQSWFVGLNFPGGYNIKFKYYIDPFFNKNYTEMNGTVKPFEKFNANVFYIALDYNVFKDVRTYGNKDKKSRPAKSDERFSYIYK